MDLCPLQDKLYQPEYQEVSTEEQREEISGKLSATSTWLEDEGFGATTVVSGLLGCLRHIAVLTSPPRVRVRRAGVSGHEEDVGLGPGHSRHPSALLLMSIRC